MKKFCCFIVVLFLCPLIFVNEGCIFHNHQYQETIVAPTCEESGYSIFECACGENYISNYTNALGHKFTNYVYDNNATYEQDGTKTAKCDRENCNATKTVIANGTKLIKRTVRLVYNNGKADQIIEIQKGQTFSQPKDPYKNNYIFTGWYTSAYLYEKYDFSTPVSTNIILYAGYTLDAAKITNTISTDIIKGVVKITNKCYNTFLGFETSLATSQGSGFCFHIQDGYYYVLTNCHVAKKISGYDNQKYTIEDYQGHTYQGYLYHNPYSFVDAIAAKYDLACLWFKPSSTNVKKLPLATENPKQNDDIVLLGAPKGQENAITYGVVQSYKTVKLSDTSTSQSNVTFDVIVSSAFSDKGSSGGPALNSNLQVVGVCYAGNSTNTLSYSIPILKVREFLTNYVYS